MRAPFHHLMLLPGLALVLPACEGLKDTDAGVVLVVNDPDTDGVVISPSDTDAGDSDSDSDDDTADDTVPIGPDPANNNGPSAFAGPDQLALLPGTTVTLDGTASSDPDGDPLTYEWVMLTQPAGSTTQLGNANKSTAFFFADVDGDYAISLTVSDGLASATDTVSVSVVEDNLPPFADAGPNQVTGVGTTVQLSGTASYDPDGAVTEYQWSLVSQPISSTTNLSGGANPALPSIFCDVAGAYVLQLTVVDDDGLASAPDIVTVTAEAEQSSDDCLDCANSDQAELTRRWSAGRAATSAGLLGLPMLLALWGRRRRED